MIEFRKDKGPWWCSDSADDCRRLAAAIVQDGRWYWVAACDNERHMAEALAEHAEHVAASDEFKLWEDVVEGPRLDGWTWHGKVA